MQPTTVGNDLFGEAGREAFLPLDSSYGKGVLADAFAGAMPQVHVYIGGKPIRDEVKVVLKQTARTVSAGRKWAS